MKIGIGPSAKMRRKLTTRNLAIAASFALITVTATIIIVNLSKTEKVYAAVCDSSYTLNWSDPTTYTVTCGSVNSSNWSVKGTTCSYFSPVFPAGGLPGGYDRHVDITVRINQSGNLDGNDTCWVYMYVNGSINYTWTVQGDSVASVFTTSQTIVVPAGGTYSITVKCKNDKTNELWQIKNGNVTACLRIYNPLPVSLIEFTAGQIAGSKNVQINWSTASEKNNDYFTIEHSLNGTDFKDLHRETGAGTSTSIRKYTYIDQNPTSGINYYRLTQTDYDGTSTIYNAIKVKVNNTTKNKTIKVYPNPVSDKFNVEFDSESQDKIFLTLSTQTGKVLYTEQLDSASGENSVSVSLPPGIKPGSYYLVLSTGSNIIGSETILVK